MTRFVLDAPTLVHLVEHDVVVHPDHQLVAPGWIRSEALTLLLRDVRAGRRTDAEVRALHEQMTEVRMRLLGDRVSRTTAYRIAREQDWDDLRDAEHVAVTRLQADALVTVDGAVAARVGSLVELAPLDALTAPGA